MVSVKKHLLAIGIGALLLVYALMASASAASLGIEPEASYFLLQRNSQQPFRIHFALETEQEAELQIGILDFEHVKLITGNNNVRTSYSFDRIFYAFVEPEAAPGRYELTIKAKAIVDGKTYSDSTVIIVEVPEATGALYLTSSYSNALPSVGGISFEKKNFFISRGEYFNGSLEFKNLGSSTDFNVFASGLPEGLKIEFQQEILREVGFGEKRQIVFSASASDSAPYGNFEATIMLKEIPTGKVFELGAIQLHVKPAYSVDAVLASRIIELRAGSSKESYLIVKNNSLDDLHFQLSASTDRIVFAQESFDLNAFEEKKIALKITAGAEQGTGEEFAAIYLKGPITRVIEFKIITVPLLSAELGEQAIKQSISNSTEFMIKEIHFNITSLPSGWSASFEPFSFNLDANASKEFTIKIVKPKDSTGSIEFEVLSGEGLIEKRTVKSGETVIDAASAGFMGLASLGAQNWPITLVIIVIVLYLWYRKSKKKPPLDFQKGKEEKKEPEKK